MKFFFFLAILCVVVWSNSWEYEGGNIPFAKLGQEDLDASTEMQSKIYHYFEESEDTFPILSVEYVQTPWETFARSFKLHRGIFKKEFDGTEKNYNEVEVSIITKVIIYMLDD